MLTDADVCWRMLTYSESAGGNLVPVTLASTKLELETSAAESLLRERGLMMQVCVCVCE